MTPLDKMVRRARLPISVRVFYQVDAQEPIIHVSDRSPQPLFNYGYICPDTTSAKWAYLSLRAALEQGDAG
jgi:hypothetical protein